MFDWQTIAVALIILAAAIYTGRMAWLRIRSFRAAQGKLGEGDCGNCGTAEKPVAAERTVFVEISRSGASTRRRRR